MENQPTGALSRTLLQAQGAEPAGLTLKSMNHASQKRYEREDDFPLTPVPSQKLLQNELIT